jgi:hypothetical protein
MPRPWVRGWRGGCRGWLARTAPTRVFVSYAHNSASIERNDLLVSPAKPKQAIAEELMVTLDTVNGTSPKSRTSSARPTAPDHYTCGVAATNCRTARANASGWPRMMRV